jgi:secondary thiamine-phosphate synthase enzyme
MHFFKQNMTIKTDGRGLYELTSQINQHIRTWGVSEGVAYLFIQHCSASLVINECYDDTARRDLEAYLERIAPEGENWYEHTIEGSDDSPAHMRALITPTNLTIPIDDGQLNLGTWQGIYLAEHRRRGHQRQLLLRVLSVE